jgi:hypothetical protein
LLIALGSVRYFDGIEKQTLRRSKADVGCFVD